MEENELKMDKKIDMLHQAGLIGSKARSSARSESRRVTESDADCEEV